MKERFIGAEDWTVSLHARTTEVIEEIQITWFVLHEIGQCWELTHPLYPLPALMVTCYTYVAGIQQ